MHRPPRRRSLLQALVLLPWWAGSLAPRPARAQGVELSTLTLGRGEGHLLLEFTARLELSRAVNDALQRGIPVYFVAEATLYRSRWYWRDQRVARVRRAWRLAFQPLTATWRVSLGALTQSFATLSEALAVVSAAGNWPVVPLAELAPDEDYYLEFSYGLDTSQLPSPMQIGLGGQADWVLNVERELPVAAGEAQQ